MRYTKEERKAIRALKQVQRDDWIKRYARFNLKLANKYELYSKEHEKAWQKTYKGVLKRWTKKWVDAFDIPWGSI